MFYIHSERASFAKKQIKITIQNSLSGYDFDFKTELLLKRFEYKNSSFEAINYFQSLNTLYGIEYTIFYSSNFLFHMFTKNSVSFLFGVSQTRDPANGRSTLYQS